MKILLKGGIMSICVREEHSRDGPFHVAQSLGSGELFFLRAVIRLLFF